MLTSLISHPAPPFSIPAVSVNSPKPYVVASSDYGGHWLLLLFYPRDFSFVCPTELTSFSARFRDFEQRNCRILAISVDSIESHVEWLATPPARGGLGPLQFPLASDADGELAKKLGIWLPEKELSTRGLFLIDPQGDLQYGVVHNLSVGRNVDEILRVLDAMQSGGLCPAGWTTADGNIDPEQALQPGRVLGHYKIQRLLGEGTFGNVFAAWDLRLERNVALKLLKRNAAESREAALREARAAAALSHPNVCGIYAVEEEDGLPVIAMEFVNGRPLTQVIAEQLPVAQKVEVAHGIASGLAAAHALTIVHGDLKPANVLVTPELVPRILDFGLSRQASRPPLLETGVLADTLSSTGPAPAGSGLEATVLMTPAALADERVGHGLSGTPAYMAPEQWRGEVPAAASDVFAFGLIFFELITGRRALAGERLADLAHQHRDPRLPVALAGQLPEPFRELFIAVLASDPAARPTAPVVRRLLENAGASVQESQPGTGHDRTLGKMTSP
jgi:alkyl hydroperoxide reductase subunit AhpC/tRNA A-37 threonylcarbamoyl transferase component Bud32